MHPSVIMCFVVHACPLGCTDIEAVAPGGTDAHNGEDSMGTFHESQGFQKPLACICAES
jgi:hypothetical protein